MASLQTTLDELLRQPREDLLDVALLLERTPQVDIGDAVAEMDLKLRNVFQAVEVCRRLLVLYRTPQHRHFDPVDALRTLSAQIPLKDLSPGAVQAVRHVYGDPEQMLECIRLIYGSVTLETGGGLRTTITTGEGAPRIVLELHESGQIPRRFSLDGAYALDLDELGDRWIAATAGGHIGYTGEAMVLYLEGDRPPTPSIPDLEPKVEALQHLSRRLRSWRGAIGHFEPGYAAPQEIVHLYREAVTHAQQTLDTVQEKPRPTQR